MKDTEASDLYNAREQIDKSEFIQPAGTEAGPSGAVGTQYKKKKKKGKGRKRGGRAKKPASKETTVPVVAMEDDVLVVPGQEFVVVSFIDKRDYTGLTEGNDVSRAQGAQNLLKVRGVFPTHELAQKRVKELMTVDPYFDMHILKCGTWTLVGAGKGEDIEYENEGVNQIMGSFFEKHYTDVDKMKQRIAAAKAQGMHGLEAAAPDKFFKANVDLGDVTRANHTDGELGAIDGKRVSAAEAAAIFEGLSGAADDDEED